MDWRPYPLGLLTATLVACFNPDSGGDTEAGSTGMAATTTTGGGPGPDDGGSMSPDSDSQGADTTDASTGATDTEGGTTMAVDDDTTAGEETTAGDTTGDDGTTTGIPDGWQARRQLTFVASILDDGLTDFPVLVVLNAGRIEYEIMQPDGTDLRFYDRNEVPLAYEIESWDSSGDSFVWVRVPEIDANDDHIFMDYGNPVAAGAQDAAAVWAGAYEAVWHLADDPVGGVVMDSTGNGHDGTLAVGSDAGSVAARVGPGLSLDGDDTITVPDDPGLDLLDLVTLEGWANPTTLAGGLSIGIVERAFYYSLEVITAINNPAGFGIRTGGLTQTVRLDDDIALNTWIHMAGTYEADDSLRLIVDGTPFDTLPVGPAPIPDNTTDVTIGAGFSGVLDEIRIASIRHTDAWEAAQYESMTDQLLTFGAAMDPPR